jgi:uncharacterized membrane protein YgcG
MRKVISILLVLLNAVAWAQKLPEKDPRLYVTDLDNLLQYEERVALDQKIRDYRAKTTTEFAIAIVPTLDGYDVADYGNKLFKKWGIGDKKLNNGLLLLVCAKERKWRIEVGYGLEPFLTDYYTKGRGDALLKPNFKQKKYYEGMDALLSDFMAKLGNEKFELMLANYKKTQAEIAAEQAAQAERDRIESERRQEAFLNGLMWFLGAAGIIGFIVLLIALDRRKKRREREERERVEREEAARKARVAKLKSDILELKKFKRNTEPTVAIIESFKYDIGQANMRKVFNTDCEEIDREVVELSDIEFELQETLTRLKYIVKESTHAIHEYEVKMKNATETEHAVNSIARMTGVLRSQQLDAKVVYDSITKKYKREVWDGRMKEPSYIDSNLKEAERLYEKAVNFLKDSKISQARECATSATSILCRSNSYLRSPYELRDSLNKAEKVMTDFETDIKNKITKAERLSKDSDVESSSKRKLTEAKTKYAGFTKTGHPLVDAAAALAILSAFDSAYRAMDSDISDAKRKREEEERRRRRNSSSSSFGSSFGSSSCSSSSCSSSSFGDCSSGCGSSSGDW